MSTKKSIITKLSILGGLLLLMSLGNVPISAVGNGSISISPASSLYNAAEPLTKGWIIEKMNPGEQVKRKVLVSNSTSEEKTVLLSEEDYYAGDQGAYSYTDKETLKSVGTWLKLEKNEVTLPANQATEVDLTITVPKDVKPGEYSGVIALQEISKEVKAGTISFVSRVSTRIYITVPGELNTGVKFNNFKFVTPDPNYTDPKKYTDFVKANYNLPSDRIFIALEYANIGNIFSKIRGNIEITNPDGQTSTYAFNRDLGYGEGDMVVPYLLTDTKWSKPGKYKAKYTFTNQPLIASNKTSVQSISPTQTVETEFDMTQGFIDQLKTDIEKSKSVISKPGSALTADSAFEVKQGQNADSGKKDETKNNNNNSTLFIIGGVIIALLVILIVYLVFKDRLPKKDKSN
jgi:hypothetical protein